ncbi:Uncharacterised protein [Buttiauxella agrestis]|uniref:Uncharacterized protein n=1 Tax=Buttiauxella agrestis TaxID=82977 RepID=A0A381C214_9ENTR|nr:Uncharacterised protein [Buttiauxella agrestis]
MGSGQDFTLARFFDLNTISGFLFSIFLMLLIENQTCFCPHPDFSLCDVYHNQHPTFSLPYNQAINLILLHLSG